MSVLTRRDVSEVAAWISRTWYADDVVEYGAFAPVIRVHRPGGGVLVYEADSIRRLAL
ncbi:MAG: hypothetical protein ABR585_07595 [Gemmatimonadaceae bacterium]